MTLVWTEPPHQPPGPRTHVLIIGVGRYRHLLGGASPTPKLPPLGQLSSPPVSARALATWFIGGRLAGAPAPLGSVELLLSDSTGQNFAGTQVDDATSQNIHTAFGQWKTRCDADPNNVAVFYFCGHGLQKDVVALLPEDFGESENNAWKQAIDFDGTYAGMARCKAGTQYYIIDACRELSNLALIDEGFGGTPLITRRLGQSNLRTAPKLFAAAENQRAFGNTNTVSRFTAALIACLDGCGAIDAGNQWVIDTLHLGPAVQKLLKHETQVQNIPDLNRQTVDPSGGDAANGPQLLHVLPPGASPTVIVNLGCNPDSIMQQVTFYVANSAGLRQQLAPQPGRWLTTVPAGFYVFGCSFNSPSGPTNFAAPPAFVRPPVWDHPIVVPPPHPLAAPPVPPPPPPAPPTPPSS
jgi:hypothetical protein